RYRKNGTLDKSFGDGGIVTTHVGAADGSSSVYGIAVRRGGKIVAAGSASDGTRADVAIAQYNRDGTLDPTFGNGGTVLTNLCAEPGLNGAYAGGVVLQPDGKIVVGGGVNFGPHGTDCFGKVRAG